MRTYYVYKAKNKINGKIYIGQTVNFKERIWQHQRCYEKEDCKFHDAIKEFGFDNFEWEILKTFCTKKEAEESEKYFIEFYNSYRDGYNENKGGVGGHNAKSVICLSLSGEYIKRYDSASDTQKDGFNSSNVLLCCKNRLYTCKNHMFMFEDDYLKYGSKQYKKPISKCIKSVIQCDLNGNFIKEFSSIQQASIETGVTRSTISGVLTGIYKSAGGYIFVYKDNFPIKDISKYRHNKKGIKVAQINPKTNEVVKIFDRISDAGRELGVSYKAIHKVVNKPNRTAYGYRWISQ